MPQLAQAVFTVHWSRDRDEINLQFNPADLDFRRSVQIAEIGIPGLDTPLLQFIRGQNSTLTLRFFFDPADAGMGAVATSVADHVDHIYGATKVDPDTHAPPVCVFSWGQAFPGYQLHASAGNQTRTSFTCLVERVDHRY